MRVTFAAMALAIVFGLASACGAVASPSKAAANASPVNASPVNATVVAQRCRCVERRWNGSCKLRICRDRW